MSETSNLYTIYEEELKELSYEPTGILEKFIYKITRKLSLTHDLSYSFEVPVSEYLRGELFCTDVSEAMGSTFTQRDLTSLLLDDFLYQAKNRSNPHDLYFELDMRSESSLQIHKYEEGSTYVVKGKKQPMRTFECVIKRKEALRLEVMLSDIADLGKEKNFTVNDVLRIIYSDFIKQYKTGNLSNVMQNIITRLSKNA